VLGSRADRQRARARRCARAVAPPPLVPPPRAVQHAATDARAQLRLWANADCYDHRLSIKRVRKAFKLTPALGGEQIFRASS
jgi:hypothetical protein